jgi:two-component sensor histidine kinase
VLHNFAEVFERRLAALSSADRLIASQGTRLARLLDQELAAAGGDAGRYSLEGPEIVLHPDCTFALCLLIHELAANAEQHGSLSVRGGRVDVTWRLDDGDLALTWTESGGPPAPRPLSPGFGNLLVAYAAMKLNGTADCLYKQSGLICDLRVSLRARWPRRRSAMRLGIPDTASVRAM